jgi:hypothetical protein
MSDGKKGSGIFWQIATPVIVALLVGGTAPWWWQEFFSQESSVETEPSIDPVIPELANSEPTAPDRTEPESVEPDPTEPEPVQQGSINLAYTGDYFACNLPINVSVGGKQSYPSGNVFQVDGVPVGQQPYTIEGQIHCPSIGSCQVYGEGLVKVIPGNTYFVGWQNVGPGQCSASLR